MIYRLILLIAQETQNVFSFCEKKMQWTKRCKGCSFNIMFFMNSAISVDDRSPYNGPACKTLTPREFRIQTSSHNNGTRVKIIFQNILKKHDI